MPAVLICAPSLQSAELDSTRLGADGLDHHRASSAEDAFDTARSLRPELVLLDKDLPQALELVEWLRSTPETRRASIVALAKGGVDALEVRLLGLGVNAILRYPVGPAWDERFATLIEIPHRRPVQVPIEIAPVTEPDGSQPAFRGMTTNVSLRGALVECAGPLPLNQTLRLAFELPSTTGPVRAKGRVVRRDTLGRYGIRFDDLAADAAAAILDFTG